LEAGADLSDLTMIPVVDIFAGAGGLGEGFAACHPADAKSPPFRVAMSAEMDAHAVRTLQTRAFFRQFPRGEAPSSYYRYAAGLTDQPWTSETDRQWQTARDEALQLKLGDPADDRALHARIRTIAADAQRQDQPWVLVGGPPCQAFSLVGRARNSGNKAYVAEHDERHFLYEHYLTILARFAPTAFVLENVKGMLSAKLDGEHVFADIFDRLQRPGGRNGPRYRIEPLVQRAHSPTEWEPRDFVVHAETLGLPQARHRVILIGLLEGSTNGFTPRRASETRYTVADMIRGMPAVRSTLTDEDVRSWTRFSSGILRKCATYARQVDRSTAAHLRDIAGYAQLGDELGTGAQWTPETDSTRLPAHLDWFVRDRRLKGILGHQARGHMASDLMRYGYAAAFAAVNGRSPRGASEFPDQLHPMHRSWFASNRFIDRFKVQRNEVPSSTITSHLAKDGHYYIHPDPLQLRSLTVREAARLQTFPDNFIFEGPVGSQRKQVGNAVPPWLGHEIAGAVYEALA
jgi:DNA (cytosine-5)-methyltransferase 1